MNPVYRDDSVKTLFTFRSPADMAQYLVGSDSDIGGYSTAKLDLDSEGRGKFWGELRTDVKPAMLGKMKSGYVGFRNKVSVYRGSQFLWCMTFKSIAVSPPDTP